ncbi:hypothetical protein [Simplicispira psychrophila]|uniref:hypothetical protein n=1 Tax=Simplicispira psychrophila TaxID=80882 RepID=UPI000482EA74|nr:hypothetical protein [Simplicispira psychrophila]
MRSEVSVSLSQNEEFKFDLEDQAPMSNEEGRRWLEDQFVSLECEPLRASGKVLAADKVLTVAQAGGRRLLADPEWSLHFARAAKAALGKPVVRVDVASMSISY